MKKQIFYVVLAILLGTQYSKAQNKGDVEVGIGFGRQASLDYQHSIISGRFKSLKSMGAGISAEYYLSKNWGIKMKALYDPKGWSTYYPSFPSKTNPEKIIYNRLDYLTIPITANWHFGKNKSWYLNFGPYFGFLLDNRDATLFLDSEKKLYRNSDFGLSYAIGYKFKVKDNIKLFFELDTQKGLTNIYKGGSESVKNFRLGLNFGVLFSL